MSDVTQCVVVIAGPITLQQLRAMLFMVTYIFI